MPSPNTLTGAERALAMLRSLPRVSLGNLMINPKSKKKNSHGRGQYGGNKHGAGDRRNTYLRIGYETGNTPFYLRFKREPYYAGHHLRREYPPLSLHKLQTLIDTDRIDSTKPIDIITLIQSGLYCLNPSSKQFGVHLTDEGGDLFKAKINIEVQWAKENVIAAIERNGGTITTAYFDPYCLVCMMNPMNFFRKGIPIPKRLLPPLDAIEYYTDPAFRGYLADPDKISEERLVLAQKYGYILPKIEDDPLYEMLTRRKDPRQVFYGLEPGWVINLKEKCILKPTDKKILEYYSS